MAAVLFCYYNDECHQLTMEENARITIGSAKRDTLTIRNTGLDEAHLIFASKSGKITLTAKEGFFKNGTELRESPVNIGDVFSSDCVSVYVCPKQADFEQEVALSAGREFLFGRSGECPICFSNKRVSSRHAKIVADGGRHKILDLDSKNHTFVNGQMITSHYLEDGDTISIAYYSIVYENGQLSFLNTGNDLKLNLDESSLARKYPFFRRSPRLTHTYEKKPLEVQAPPTAHGKPEINWLTVFLPPIVMIGVYVASIVLTDGSLFNLLFVVPMSLLTVLTTILSYFAQRKKHSADSKQKKESYEEYIEQVFSEVQDCYAQQLSTKNNANPETAYCRDIVASRMRRLWERSVNDPDFLDVRLGCGTLALDVELIFPKTSVGEMESPQLTQLRARLDSLALVKDIAITLPLKEARSIGVVGNRQVAVRAMQNAVVQLTTHHSYVDLNMVIVSGERDYEHWSWARWLPHCWLGEHQICCVSATKKEAAELLNEYEEVLKKRITAVNSDAHRTHLLLPCLVFIITEPDFVENREFLHLAMSAPFGAGLCMFLMFDSFHQLPRECDWFIELNNSGGNLYSRSCSEQKTFFSLDSFGGCEPFARAMAPIRDRAAAKNGKLPDSVTFFQGYGIQKAEELNIISNWKDSCSYQSLAVPIGTRMNGRPFLFDISEKAHGPHGLVAGTTGSGKSEILQTWILSMCVWFPPQDVSFVLIDFKGMGLAGTLKGLPHIAGTISDVDENIHRNLISLESELNRRKLLFAEVSSEKMKIGDIYDYQEAYRQGKVEEPLSHLIVVVDEFAELRSKFPDFMAALDSAARVGRSLGVHLVLATQKPDGVVTDEVRANAKFKWCLRVANEAESRAVISRPEAAMIPSSAPGRAYIQVGNNEVFELVQTYFSGGSVKKASESSGPVSVAFLGSLGRRKYINKKHREDERQEKELLVLVRQISAAHRLSGLPSARKIWEDSLPKRITLSQLQISDKKEKPLLAAAIGMVDDPHHQRQYPYEINFAEEGHLLIYGAPSTGKTFLLQTIMMSLATRYTPEEVTVYGMDFGSWSLSNLQTLPHVGGVANGNETEKITNLAKMLAEILDKRKVLFARFGVNNLASYRQVTGKRIPAVVVIVDNFAPVREMYPDVEHFFVQLSREGSNYGIFLVITASSLSGSVSYYLTQNFKQASALRMTERSDYRDIVGDTEGLEPAKNAGRGLVRGKPPMEFQTALAVDAKTDIEYVANLKKECARIASNWHGFVPDEIPVMPEIVLFSHLKHVAPDMLALGLSDDSIQPVTISMESRLTLISGAERSGKTNLLYAIYSQLAGTQDTVYIDGGEPSEAQKLLPLFQEVASGRQATLLLDNFTQWLSSAGCEEIELLESLISHVKSNGFSLYAAADANELISEGGVIAGKLIRSSRAILLGGSFNEHSSQFEASNLGYSEQGKTLKPFYGYLLQKKKARMFKVVFAGGKGNGL